ncbi:hypothetical protein KEJ45_05495 [Candidatus Bathyarchaeota archaeon]|nr:hypothetical protein [Candidatus Bathyarchaeota archaeon]
MMINQIARNFLYTFSLRAGRGLGWGLQEGLTLAFAIVWFFVELIVMAIVLYIAGLIVVGKRRALFSDAFIIALVGTFLSTLFIIFIPYGLLASILGIIVWLLLIKQFYETGWLGAIAVGILAIIIFLAVLILLALVFGIFAVIFEWLISRII